MIKKIKKILRILFVKDNDEPVNIPFYTREFFSDGKYSIGEYTYGNPIIPAWDNNANLKIGKFCSIAGGVHIFLGGNHRKDWITTYPFPALTENWNNAAGIVGHPVSSGDVNIGNDVWIGMNATILSGVTIGDGAIIAAFSIVTKNVEPYTIYGGNPARIIGKRFENDVINELLKIKWWNWDISKINEEVKTLCSSNIDDFIKLHKQN